MSFNWSDYLDVAQELIEKVRGQAKNHSQQEANLRSAKRIEKMSSIGDAM